MKATKEVDLQKITRLLIRFEIQRLQNNARDYFYAYNTKSVKIRTRSVQEMYNFIINNYKIDDKKSKLLGRGITREIANELIAKIGKRNITKIKESNQIYFEIVMENADYHNIARKHKKDNIIKQNKEKAKISIQLDKDLRDAMRDYCDTKSITMSSIVRDKFIKVLEDNYYSDI